MFWTNGIARHSGNEKKTFHRTHPATSTNEAIASLAIERKPEDGKKHIGKAKKT